MSEITTAIHPKVLQNGCSRVVTGSINFSVSVRKRTGALIILLLVTFYLYYKVSTKTVNYSLQSQTNPVVTDEPPLANSLDVQLFRVTPTMRQSLRAKLPKLDALNWPDGTLIPFSMAREVQNDSLVLPSRPFQPVMSYGQRILFQKLLRNVSDMLFNNGLGDRFMLSSDAILGSFRHHDMVPWSDHAGFMIDVTVRVKVRGLLRTLSPSILLHQTPSQDIIYAKLIDPAEEHKDLPLSRIVPSKEYGWPHIHIEYFEMNGTHITSTKQANPPRYSWPYDVVFPLYLRPFGPDWFPTPRNPREFLYRRYNAVDLCETQGSSHVTERRLPLELIRCSDLGERYAFVDHKACGIGVQVASSDEMVLGEERLIRRKADGGKEVIHRICLAVPVESIKCDPYTLHCTDPY